MELTKNQKDLFNSLFEISKSILNIYQKMIDEPSPNLIQVLKLATSYENKIIWQIKKEIDEVSIAEYINKTFESMEDQSQFRHLMRISNKFQYLLFKTPINKPYKDIDQFKIMTKEEDILSNLKYKNTLAIQNAYQQFGFHQKEFNTETYSETYAIPYLEEIFLKNGALNQELVTSNDLNYLSFHYGVDPLETKEYIIQKATAKIKNDFAKFYLKSNFYSAFYLECIAIDLESYLLLLPEENIKEIYQFILAYCLSKPIEFQIRSRRLLEIFDNIQSYRDLKLKNNHQLNALTEIEFKK